MGKSSTFENDLLKLLFHGTAIANVADNAAVSPATSLYVSLHTANPESGTQATSECTWGAYARLATNRSSASWTISGGTVTPVATIEWAEATSGSQTATHWGIGTASSGTGKLLYSGTISPAIAIASGVTPRLTTASTVTED
jgi:hypothetical protein